MIGIYKITSPSRRVYIGQSVNVKKRFNAYKFLDCKCQRKIYNSLKKYGFEKHKFEILIECEVSELNDKERYFQEIYNSVNNGMNCSFTKSTDRNGYHSKESIELMKIARAKRGPESFAKYSETRTGSKLSEETKRKISEKLKGQKLSIETKLKMSFSKSGSGNSKSKKVLCTITNKIYDSVAICERENDIKFNSLCNKLNGNRTNNTNFIYL